MSVEETPQPGAPTPLLSPPTDSSAPQLPHVDPTGQARMVDAGAKPATGRRARAEDAVRMSGVAFALLR